MKKLLAIALALVLVLGLCACGSGEEGKDTDNKKENSSNNSNSGNNTNTGNNTSNNGSSAASKLPETPKGYGMEIKGVTFGIGMDAEKVVAKLGECDLVKSESCGDMGGNDYDYDFGDFVIYANDGDGAIRIYSMAIMNDLASTAEGITIGSLAEEVKDTYGNPTNESEIALEYEKDGMVLKFVLKDGEVKDIQYME